MNEKGGHRKYICHTTNAYYASQAADYISKLGKEPDKYELISILPAPNHTFDIFYKEFINED